jgi:zinc protease
MVDVLSEVLREPSFPQGDIENYRGQVLTRLREQSDDPGSVAEKLFYELAYPSAHPYRHWEMGDEQSVASFTRDDLVAFHRRFVRPAGMNVAVVGGMAFDRVQRRLSDALGDWRDDGLVLSFDAPGAVVPGGFVRRNVAIAGKSQTSIVMGLPTISRKSPDYYALSFASLVLGGLGMMGRLGDVVRDQMGLAYHVSCDLDSTLGPGAWEVHAGVNAANVDSAIEAIRGEVRRLRDEPISDAELADGKAYLTGILPLALETSSGIARVLQQIEIYGHGLDYLEKHVAAIEALTKEGIQEAASRYLSADNLIAIVAG